MKAFSVWALILFGVLGVVLAAVGDIRDRVQEQERTWETTYAVKIRVEPGAIHYTKADRSEWVKAVPPDTRVRWYPSAGPGEPLKIETWSIRGQQFIRITTQEGYPLYD